MVTIFDCIGLKFRHTGEDKKLDENILYNPEPTLNEELAQYAEEGASIVKLTNPHDPRELYTGFKPEPHIPDHYKHEDGKHKVLSREKKSNKERQHDGNNVANKYDNKAKGDIGQSNRNLNTHSDKYQFCLQGLPGKEFFFQQFYTHNLDQEFWV